MPTCHGDNEGIGIGACFGYSNPHMRAMTLCRSNERSGQRIVAERAGIWSRRYLGAGPIYDRLINVRTTMRFANEGGKT